MIGDLYDANNVLVGQAAVMVAAANTPLPDLGTANLADPFDPAPWTSQSVVVAATSSYTLSYGGEETSALTDTSTVPNIKTALEALSTIGVGNVVVTGSAGTAYTVQIAETVAQFGGVLTADATSGTATISGGLWVPVGATDQGWTYATNKSTQAINIEEQSTPVATAITSQSVTLDGALSEDISRTLAIAYNALLTINAATSTEPGYDNLTLSDDVTYYAAAVLTSHFNGKPRWIYAPKWSQLSNTTTAFRRSTAKRMYPVSFATVCKPTEIRVVNFTSAKTA